MVKKRSSTKKTAERWLEDNPSIDHVMAAVADINGCFRGKRLPKTQAAKALSGSLRMPVSTLGVDIWGLDVLENGQVFETGDADGRLEPTERGLLPMPWTEPAGAFLPLWMATDDGQPYEGDPRRALSALVERFRHRGLTPVVATELEFYLVEFEEGGPKPPRSQLSGADLVGEGVLSVEDLDAFGPFLSDVYAACEAQAIPADAAISEGGSGQFEINFHHVDDPLKAADDALFFKRLVKAIARKHRLAATFMAKPYHNRAGNGFHLHFSLLDKEGRNVFDDGGDRGSLLLRQAVGGMIQAMEASALLFAPHQNSYRRLQKESHAPVALSWGYDNRTTAIRIPGGAPAARRIEHRVAGADANPYLVMAAVLGAALAGIKSKIEPPAPIKGDAYSADLPCLPPDWGAAIRAFEESDIMEDILNPMLNTMIVTCKRQEMARFAADISSFEYRSYLDAV